MPSEPYDSSKPMGHAIFATTHWSVVLAAQGSSPQAAEALETLCRTYWYPLYAYVRRRGHGAHEAEDLTQEFFTRLLANDFPAHVKPEGGKFRSYLLVSLKRFLVNEWKNRRVQKRGGGAVFLPLDQLGAEERYQLEPADNTTPETLFDRRWASVTLDRARERLKEEFVSRNKAGLYQRLEPCLTGAERLVPYQELASELGLAENAVKMAVHRMRSRYGELLRLEIAHTVSRPEEIEEEIRS